MTDNGGEPRLAKIWAATVSAVRPCRGCGASIVFAQRVGADPAKLTPYRAPLDIVERQDAALVIRDTNHFIDCPQSKQFRKGGRR